MSYVRSMCARWTQAAVLVVVSRLLLCLLASSACLLACRKPTSSVEGDSGTPRNARSAKSFGAAPQSIAKSECHTALLETTSCRGEDTSFQECHFYFRADGVPRADVCRAFLDLPVSAATSDAGDGGCNELSPSAWKRSPCGDYELPAEFTCFSCASERHEASRQLVQAFTPTCEHAIVLKACNVDLRSVSVGGPPPPR